MHTGIQISGPDLGILRGGGGCSGPEFFEGGGGLFTLFTLEAVQAARLFSHCLQLNTFRSHGGSRHTNLFN